mgnify:FL=1
MAVITEELDGYDVVAARSKDGDEPSDYIKVQCKYSGNSKELILKGVPKGNWYIGVHGYKYLDGSNKKVLSKWAEVQKVTVKTSLVTGKPAVKSAKVSRQGTKRKVTVKLLYQKPVTERTGYWQRKYLNPKMEVIHMSAVMLILRKIRRKLQSFLKM